MELEGSFPSKIWGSGLRCFWFKPFGFWRSAVGPEVADVSTDRNVFIIRVEMSLKSMVLYFESEDMRLAEMSGTARQKGGVTCENLLKEPVAGLCSEPD